jgi:predicted RNA binding protein YcfA (HicA-like mRNA interferase family)
MGKIRTLDDCKSGKDFARYVEHNPLAHDIRQSGSHMCVKGPKPGTAVIPVHDCDLPPGTRKSVIKMLILIGLGVLLVVLIIGGL